MLEKKISRVSRNGIFNFMRYYVSFENKETMLIFDKEIEELTGRITTMGTEQYLLEKAKNTGIQEGIRKGAELSKEQTVKNLITQLDLSDNQIAGIVEVSVDFIKKIRAELK